MKLFYFEVDSLPSLVGGLDKGFSSYALNEPDSGVPSTLWLRLGDKRTLRIGVRMHDLENWEEIGTLTFEFVNAEDAPNMVNVPTSWLDVKEIKKLVYVSDECKAECGFVVYTSSGDRLVVLPANAVWTLALKAPFYSLPFYPENNLALYKCEDF